MTTDAACVHHWLINTPNGATSTGRCLKCGEKRAFKNYAGDQFNRTLYRDLGPRRYRDFTEGVLW